MDPAVSWLCYGKIRRCGCRWYRGVLDNRWVSDAGPDVLHVAWKLFAVCAVVGIASLRVNGPGKQSGVRNGNTNRARRLDG